MGRWEPDSRDRSHEAALALYAERGLDQTTASEIAAWAGLNERGTPTYSDLTSQATEASVDGGVHAR